MGATAPALRLPLCSKTVALPGRNRDRCGRSSGRTRNYSKCCYANECSLRCSSSSSSSSKVSCGSATRSRSSFFEPGRKVTIASGLWSSRAGIGLSSFTGTWVDEIQCKLWNPNRLDARRSGRQRGRVGRTPFVVYMIWGGGKVEAPKPNYVPLEQIGGEDEFNKALDEAKERGQPIIVDWLASWCRKCIYLKPKLEKLAAEFHPDLKFYCVDVNSVPQALVKRANVTKMPTIQLWKDGDHVAEVIGGHQAWLVVDEVREMINLKK